MAKQSPTSPIILDTQACAQHAPESFTEPLRGNTTWHTLLSAPNTPTSSLSAGVAVCPSNGTLALHRHRQAEIYYILSGTGEVEIEGKRQRVSQGMVLWIPGDAEHGVFCGGDETLKWLYIFPEGSFENVIYRFRHEMGTAEYGEIAKL